MKELSHKNSFVLTGKLAQKEEEWNSLQRAVNFKHLEILSLHFLQPCLLLNQTWSFFSLLFNLSIKITM